MHKTAHIIVSLFVGAFVLTVPGVLAAETPGDLGIAAEAEFPELPTEALPPPTPQAGGEARGTGGPATVSIVDPQPDIAETAEVGEVAEPAGAAPSGPESADGDSAGESKAGLRGVLKLFTGQRGEDEPTPGPAAAPEDDEELRRVNELTRLATTNIDRGRAAEAMRNINELIALKPYEANYHFALGLCYRRLGKFPEALKKYQDVLDLGGPKALVAVLKAEAFAAQADRDKVIQYLRESAIGGRNIIMDMGTLPALSNYQQDTEFVKLALQLEKFSVTRSKGHDPFTNPFPKFDLRRSGREEVQEMITKLSPEEQEKLLLDARKTYERVKFYIKLEDEGKAMKEYVALRDFIKKKDLITIPKIGNDFRILVAQLESLEIEIEGIRLKYYYNQAQVKLKQIKDAFTDGEYKRVEGLHSEVTKLTGEMRQVNRNYGPVADQIQAASTRWHTRAETRKEFEVRKPMIQGIVIAPEGKLAVLNNRLVRQGEAVEDFRVVKVESNKVTFRYKGEDIPLLFRRY